MLKVFDANQYSGHYPGIAGLELAITSRISLWRLFLDTAVKCSDKLLLLLKKLINRAINC